ncbi:hypothetical protein, partial [Jannaschia helgolandensis]|uniref:hypothetical protein n=1 Tax=Jannaschia helgolandensis TaxID=188906 RepID=UPI0030DCAFB1
MKLELQAFVSTVAVACNQENVSETFPPQLLNPSRNMVGLAPKRARQSISAARRLPTPTSVRNYNNRLVCEKNAGELLP